jgi:nucleotide-binding universal stress UspA family protein
MGMTSMPADPAAAVALDRAQADHASDIAEDGARIARGLGAIAEAVALVDEADPAATLIALAEERDAAAIVVGSRGLGGGFKARMHGSTTRKLMQGTHRPVLVVRLPD